MGRNNLAFPFFLSLVAVVTSASPSRALEAVSIRDYFVLPEERDATAIEEPSCIASFPDGTIAVGDVDGRKVILRYPDGRKKALAVRAGGLVVNDGKLIVTEASRIRMFNRDGDELPVLADDTVRDFSRTLGMNVDERGNVYIADSGRDVVFVLSADGLPLSIIGENADGDAELSNPVDAAVDGRGRIFIADAGNERIAIYSTGGVYRGQITGIEKPVAVAVDSAGLVYVADADQNRVLRYDVTGKLLGSFGTKGRSRGQFRRIVDMELGSDGLLRVLDSSNRSLHILAWPAPEVVTAAPRVIPLSARWGGMAQVNLRPIGTSFDNRLVAADPDGNVLMLDQAFRELARFPAGTFRDPSAAVSDGVDRLYVADRATGEVHVFDRNLQLLFTFGKGSRVLFFRGGEGKLVSPCAVALSNSGLVAVADKNKVEIFGPDGTYMATVGKDAPDEGVIDEPIGVAFGPDGAIFVADAGSGMLARYDASGNFQKRVGNLEPLAMGADEEGRVYLLEENGPRILVYAPDLEPMLLIGTPGEGRGSIRRASALVCAKDELHVGVRDGIVSIPLDLPLSAPALPVVSGAMRSLVVTWPRSTLKVVSAYRVTIDDMKFETADTTLVASGLADEKAYAVRIASLNRFGLPGYSSESVPSRTLTLALSAPPPPSVMTVQGGARVSIAWDADSSPYVASYAIEGQRNGLYERLSTVEAAHAGMMRVTMEPGATRRFRVRAIADNGKEGPPSVEGVYSAGEGFDALAAASYALAAEKFLSATSVESDNARIWSGLGEASEKLERFSEAARAFGRALEIEPRDTISAFGLARLALLKGDSLTARRALAGLASSGVTTDPEFFYIGGMIAMADEEYETAVRRLSSAVSANPSARNRAALSRAEEAQRLFGENRPRLEISDAEIHPVFPALYKIYATAPIGAATVRNAGRFPLDRLRFSVFIRGAMDFPAATLIMRLEPGESIRVAIRAELSNSILDATEDETKQAELRLTYYRSGEPVEVKQTVPFRLLARTALQWDDPRKIASFVTTRAPVVAEFARNVAGYGSDLSGAVNAPLRIVLLLRNALAVYGIRYQQDPLNPYRDVSENAQTIDHVQLPEETLRNKGGDCDDLVVLYASLLENLGVRTAAADLPGHILLLIDSELPPEAADQVVSGGAWILREGTVWIPIETTMLEGTFEETLRSAAESLKSATIIDLREAWSLYPPVTTQSSSWRAALPDRDATMKRNEPDESAARLRRAVVLAGADAALAGTDPEAAIRAGIVYGRMGLLDQAENFFRQAGETSAALNNLGNVALLRGDAARARAYYEQAAGLDPEDEGIKANLEKMK